LSFLRARRYAVGGVRRGEIILKNRAIQVRHSVREIRSLWALAAAVRRGMCVLERGTVMRPTITLILA
jgi:hypothetical protein